MYGILGTGSYSVSVFNQIDQLKKAITTFSQELQTLKNTDPYREELITLLSTRLAQIIRCLLVPANKQLHKKIEQINMEQISKERLFRAYISPKSKQFIKIPVRYQEKTSNFGYHEDLYELLPEALKNELIDQETDLFIQDITTLLVEKDLWESLSQIIVRISTPDLTYLEAFDTLIATHSNTATPPFQFSNKR